jgi:hypothetical protein
LSAALADFTAQEQLHVRAALRFLRSRCGTWSTLARALRFGESTIANVATSHKPVTATVVVRIAKFVGVGVDDVLCGRFPAPGTCPHCGHPPVAAEGATS